MIVKQPRELLFYKKYQKKGGTNQWVQKQKADF